MTSQLAQPVISFQPSTRPHRRVVFLRNPTSSTLIYKCQSELGSFLIKPGYGCLRAKGCAVFFVYADGDIATSKMFGQIHVYARLLKSPYSVDLENWFQSPGKESELCYKIRVERRTGFTPYETVIDLPGSAILVESVPYPMFGVDDSDTKTAIGIDEDTKTVRPFDNYFFDQCLPSESMLSTCEDIAADCRTSRNILSDTNTARNINEKGWIQHILDMIFVDPTGEDGIHRKMGDCFACGVPPFAATDKAAIGDGEKLVTLKKSKEL